MEPFLGQIQAFGFNFAPRGWAFCDGQILSIAQNTALFSLLGTMYGGNGQTTFALPDLRGRSIVHPGSGPGLAPISVGQQAGSTSVTLIANNLPSHTHQASIAVNSSIGEENNPANNKIAARTNSFSEDVSSGAVLGGVTIGNTGSNMPFEIRNPYLGIYHSIALEGIYPSRS